MSEERKTKNEVRNDWGDKIREVIREINTRNMIMRRQDGSVFLNLPGMAALVVAVIIPQLAVIVIIAHLLDLIKVEITRSE